LRSVRMTTNSRSLVSARDDWWTLDFANAFVSPGVNSRGELVPSHGASRRRLGDEGNGRHFCMATMNLLWHCWHVWRGSNSLVSLLGKDNHVLFRYKLLAILSS
jgi:hypothetical protein